MNPDISAILSAWPFEPGQLTCRMFTGLDGEARIQVRLDLGLLQMHADGRPDGERPFGFGSYLEYFEDQLESVADQKPLGAEIDDDSEPLKTALTPEDCRVLRDEAEMFYRRYVALLVLEEFDRVVRDTTRNLRVLDLCQKFAQSDDDRVALEQYRPYILMVRTRALASQALKDNEPKAAVHALDDGLEQMKRHFAEHGGPQAFENSNEAAVLRNMREALVPKLPISQRSELKARLAKAIADENYELAAILRDELKQLKD
ncbi:MAG: hypothetical protein GC200_03615 [Tepidisphaera sp.]|nr:hypothetical protein [Tepidisphaera sp.]